MAIAYGAVMLLVGWIAGTGRPANVLLAQTPVAPAKALPVGNLASRVTFGHEKRLVFTVAHYSFTSSTRINWITYTPDDDQAHPINIELTRIKHQRFYTSREINPSTGNPVIKLHIALQMKGTGKKLRDDVVSTGMITIGTDVAVAPVPAEEVDPAIADPCNCA